MKSRWSHFTELNCRMEPRRTSYFKPNPSCELEKKKKKQWLQPQSVSFCHAELPAWYTQTKQTERGTRKKSQRGRHSRKSHSHRHCTREPGDRRPARVCTGILNICKSCICFHTDRCSTALSIISPSQFMFSCTYNRLDLFFFSIRVLGKRKKNKSDKEWRKTVSCKSEPFLNYSFKKKKKYKVFNIYVDLEITVLQWWKKYSDQFHYHTFKVSLH